MPYKDPEKKREYDKIYRIRKKKEREVDKYIKVYYARKKKRERHCGKEFTVSRDYLRSIWTEECPILGKPLVVGHKDFQPTLDRIDSNKGYIPGNVQWLSRLANNMKSNASLYGLQRFATGVLRLYGPAT